MKESSAPVMLSFCLVYVVGVAIGIGLCLGFLSIVVVR